MRKVLLGVAALLAASLALVGTDGAEAAGPVAVVPGPAAAAEQQAASPVATYTWTRTDTSGRVLFTRSGVLPQARTTFGGEEQQQPVAAIALPGIGTNACCSPSACDTVDVVRGVGGLVFGWSHLANFHHRVYWCWTYPRITGVNVSCYATDLSQWFGVQFNGCGGGGYYYSWAGSSKGGHYSLRQGDFSQCIPSVACSAHVNPWIQLWVNGNGAWTQQQGS